MKSNLFHRLSSSKQSGFTLLEVLVTLLIVSFGLLGMAALQISALKNNLSAHHRSQATILAYDIVDRMRANITTIDNYVGIPDASVAAVDNCRTDTGCTPANMALNDLAEWRTDLAELPGGTGAVSSGALTGGGTFYTIEITWNDRGDASDPVFEMSFHP